MIVAAAGPLLVFVALLASSVWVGGFVAIAVVARVAREQLDPPARVAFFRALGRRYLVVGGSALGVSLASGAALLATREWDATALAAVLVTATLVLVTISGIAQARGMTRARAQAVRAPDDPQLAEQVRRGAARAAALRATIGLLTLALLVLAAVLAT